MRVAFQPGRLALPGRRSLFSEDSDDGGGMQVHKKEEATCCSAGSPSGGEIKLRVHGAVYNLT